MSFVEHVVDALVLLVFLVAFFGIGGYLLWTFARDNPRLNLVRRMLTKGLRVDANQSEVRRGEAVEASVTVSTARGLGELEVGLVCTESYDYESTTSSRDSAPTTSRETAHAVAYEAWEPVESAVGSQSFRLPVPPNAPFTYQGDCLSFKWEVVARGGKKHRLDAQASQQIAVLP